MDICQREGLHQVDLLSPAADKITQQEYHAQRRGQLNLDIANMELLGDGITPMHTTFETNKEKIRNAISDIAERATSFEEFQRLLKAEYGILVKDHRGRFSYLPAHPPDDRNLFLPALSVLIMTATGFSAFLQKMRGTKNGTILIGQQMILWLFCSLSPICALWLTCRPA